jgi:hypothetical protein
VPVLDSEVSEVIRCNLYLPRTESVTDVLNLASSIGLSWLDLCVRYVVSSEKKTSNSRLSSRSASLVVGESIYSILIIFLTLFLYKKKLRYK